MYTREQTTRVKGIAALLRVIRPCFAFPARQPDSFKLAAMLPVKLQNSPVYLHLGNFGKICIPLFLFLGGYGLYASKIRKEEGKTSLIHGFSRTVIRLYVAFWKVFLIFVPIGLIFARNQKQYCEDNYIWKAFSDTTVGTFVSNFFSWSSTYNREWWFFKYYIFSVFIGYVFLEIFREKRNLYTELFSVLVWGILVSHVFPFFSALLAEKRIGENPFFEQIFLFDADIFWNSSMLLMGIVFAKYGIFDTWKSLLKKLKFFEKKLVSCGILSAVFLFRCCVIGNRFDLVVVPVFIFAFSALVDDVRWLSDSFLYLGENSTNLWLVHTFFCYYFERTAKVVYISKKPLIALATLLFMCLMTSFLLEKFWGGIGKVYHRLLDKTA